MTSTTQNDDLDLRALLKILVRRRWVLAIGALLGTGLGFVAAVLTKETYQANATVSFASARPNAAQLAKPAKEMAESPHVLNRVLEKLNVKIEPTSDTFVARAGDNELYLRTVAESRELAGQLAKTWAEVVAHDELAQAEAIAQTQREALTSASESARKELQDRQEKMRQFIKDNDAFESLQDYPIFDSYRVLQTDQDERLAELNRLMADIQLYDRPDVSPDELSNSPEARRDEKISSLRKRLTALDAEKLSLEKTETDALHKIDEQQEALRKAMLEAVRKLAGQKRMEIESLKTLIEQNSHKLAQMQKEITKAKIDNQIYSALENDIHACQKRATNTSQRLEEFEANNITKICSVSEDGEQNTDILKKKEYKKFSILGLAAGAFVALIVVGLIEASREDGVALIANDK